MNEDIKGAMVAVGKEHLYRYAYCWRPYYRSDWRPVEKLYEDGRNEHVMKVLYDRGKIEIFHVRTILGWVAVGLPRKHQVDRLDGEKFSRFNPGELTGSSCGYVHTARKGSPGKVRRTVNRCLQA